MKAHLYASDKYNVSVTLFPIKCLKSVKLRNSNRWTLNLNLSLSLPDPHVSYVQANIHELKQQYFLATLAWLLAGSGEK